MSNTASRILGTLKVLEGLAEIAAADRQRRVVVVREQPSFTPSWFMNDRDFRDLVDKVRAARMGFELSAVKAAVNKGSKFSARQAANLVLAVVFLSDRDGMLKLIVSHVVDRQNLRHELRTCNLSSWTLRDLGL